MFFWPAFFCLILPRRPVFFWPLFFCLIPPHRLVCTFSVPFFTSAFTGFLMMAMPTLVSMATLSVYGASATLTPQVIFPALGYFNILQGPANQLPALIVGKVQKATPGRACALTPPRRMSGKNTAMIRGKISEARVSQFLLEEEARLPETGPGSGPVRSPLPPVLLMDTRCLTARYIQKTRCSRMSRSRLRRSCGRRRNPRRPSPTPPPRSPR